MNDLPTRDVVWCLPHQCGQVEHKWWDDVWTKFVCMKASEFPVQAECVPVYVTLTAVIGGDDEPR